MLVVAIVIPIVVVFVIIAAIAVYLYRRKLRNSQGDDIPMEPRKSVARWEKSTIQGVEIGSLIGVGSFGIAPSHFFLLE